jgi:hemerythrin
MPLIKWAPKLSVNIAEIDDQHKELIRLINDLHDAMMAGNSQSVMKEIFENLNSYIRTHFATEETLMQKYGFPGLDAHRKEHAKFAQRIFEFQEQFEKGQNGLALKLMPLLENWLEAHLISSDKVYAAFLNSKGVY